MILANVIASAIGTVVAARVSAWVRRRKAMRGGCWN